MRIRHVLPRSISRRAVAQTASFNPARSCKAYTAVITHRHPATSCLHHSSAPTRRWSSTVPSTAQTSDNQTIFALSTAPGKAAIAIIRISGKQCLDIYRALCPDRKLPRPRTATLRSLHDPALAASDPTSVLDSSTLVLFFPSPATVTGEHVLELHIHGGPATTKAVLGAIARSCDPNTVRYAEPGEFTRRAFLNDRLDLTQVEALGDTLSATTEHQRRVAVRGSASGSGPGQQYDDWARQLLYARGELEALIDFSEDQHFEESPRRLVDSVAGQVRQLNARLKLHAANAMRGELLREGITCSLLGAPNVGKSSLLNRIVGREAAIVSPEAGTTRDVIEVSLDIGGYLVRFGDTAGLRSASQDSAAPVGLVEQEGVRRAKDKARDSDLVLVMLSFTGISNRPGLLNLDPQVIETVRELREEGSRVMVIVNKTDLKPREASLNHATDELLHAIPGIDASMVSYITCNASDDSSAVPPPPPTTTTMTTMTTTTMTTTTMTTTTTSDGIQDLLSALTARFESMTSPLDDDAAQTSLGYESLGATQRHRLLLEEASENLAVFLDVVDAGPDAAGEELDVVLAAERLRSAAAALGKITGRGVGAGDVEAVLGVVFEKFCVGK